MILYRRTAEAIFLERPNRFIAHCLLEGQQTVCHVKNTGRCKELLIPGCRVILAGADNPLRKTAWDLVAVESRGFLVNMDSQAPNLSAGEWLRSGGYGTDLQDVRPETVYRDSRLDFSYKRGDVTGFVEVKGVTLFNDEGTAAFPDAPTERGIKHLHTLMEAVKDGHEAAVLFVIQRESAACLVPNQVTHPAFAQALQQAADSGVRLLARTCLVTPQRMTIHQEVPVYPSGRPFVP